MAFFFLLLRFFAIRFEKDIFNPNQSEKGICVPIKLLFFFNANVKNFSINFNVKNYQFFDIEQLLLRTFSPVFRVVNVIQVAGFKSPCTYMYIQCIYTYIRIHIYIYNVQKRVEPVQIQKRERCI